MHCKYNLLQNSFPNFSDYFLTFIPNKLFGEISDETYANVACEVVKR